MERKYLVKITRPDGTVYSEEYKDFNEAFDAYWFIKMCPRWVARLYTNDDKLEWIEL